MNVNEEPIKWEHIVNLFKIDSKQTYRRCPKITINHVELSNSAKMRVCYAVQVSFAKNYFQYCLIYKSEVRNNKFSIPGFQSDRCQRDEILP